MACENTVVNKIVLDVRELTTLCDYFVIAEGKNEKQTQALCEYVEEELEKDGIYHVNKEGYHSADWILIGYDEVIVHIFKPETREFYDLEHVWQDAVRVDVSDITE